MDPKGAIFRFSQRTAARLTGHRPNCGCAECTVQAQLLRSDRGIQRAIQFIYKKGAHRSHGKEAREVLSDLANGPPHAQPEANGEQSASPISHRRKPVLHSDTDSNFLTPP